MVVAEASFEHLCLILSSLGDTIEYVSALYMSQFSFMSP